MEAAVEVIPVPTGHRPVTQVGLVARYRPPLGRLGAMGDAVAGSRIVLESVERFIDDLATRIEAEVDLPADTPRLEDGPIPATSGSPGAGTARR